MRDEDDRLKEAFMDMLNQACGEWINTNGLDHKFKGYDSMCLSAYENALDLAVEFGWIKKEEVLR
jgi:hypothetical protein